METLFSIKERAARFRRDVDTHAQEWLGCHYAGDGAYVFRVWAPHAEAVSLVGDFNSWDPAECPMERLEDSDIWEGVRAGDSGIRLLQVRCRLPGGGGTGAQIRPLCLPL